MKFAFCLYKYFPYGGLQRDFLRFAQEATSRNHSVRVYCMSWQGDTPDNLDIQLIPVKALSNHRRNSRFTQQVAESLKKQPVDVIVGFNKMPGLDIYFAADSCYEYKAQVERSWLYRLDPRYKHFSRYEQEVFLPKKKPHILLISETEKQKFIHYYNTPEERMHMLPPGIEKDRRASQNRQAIRSEFRQEFTLAIDETLLLFIGSGFIKKGLDRAIKSLASLPAEQQQKTFLYVLGQDKEQRYIKLAKKLGVSNKVKFLGPRDDIPRFLAGADFLIHPAIDEAAGIVLLEALVAGLPVLVSDICGYAYHIDKAQAGCIIPSPFSQKDFNQQLSSIIAQTELRQLWSKNALEYAENEDLYSMHATGIDIIERLYTPQT